MKRKEHIIIGLFICILSFIVCGQTAQAAKKNDMITITLCETPGSQATKRIKVKKGRVVTLPVLENIQDGDTEYVFVGWRKESGGYVKENPRFYKDTWLYSAWVEYWQGKPITGYTPTSNTERRDILKKEKPVLTSRKVVNRKKIQFAVEFDDFIYRHGLVKKLEIKYATNKKFKSAETKKVGYTRHKMTLSNLKKGKTYYIKVRGYSKYKIDGKMKKCYTKWSKTYKIKLK